MRVSKRADDHITKGGYRKSMWECVCDCGNVSIVSAQSLKSGATQSCGCFQREVAAKANFSHGLHGTRLYSIWQGMNARCYRKTNISYKHYGGKGIIVCDEWRDDFQAFYDWAMANGYRDGLTLDRIEGTKGYCPDNCRWVTWKKQGNNTARNRVIQYRGEAHTMAEWSDILHMDYWLLSGRINELGWSVEKAFETPARKMNKQTRKVLQKDSNGVVIKEYKNIREASLQNGYNQGNITQCCNGERKTAYGYIWGFLEE